MELREKNKLLYARAGFGISLEDYEHPLPIEEAVAKLFPKTPPGMLVVISDAEWAEFGPTGVRPMDADQRRKKVEEFLTRMKDVNHMWYSEMVSTSYPLWEKMTLFWHGHFATRLDNPFYDQKLLNIFRKNALGNFKDMLRAVSKNEIMVMFLNNKQNVKEHPNENFSREVMELFTLGRDNYTEHDVREAGRAFTGWSIDNDGAFVFKEDDHDNDEKQFLGRKGNFNGDDILNILLEQKQTAVFVVQKMYRFFVSDENIDEQRVAVLADNFYKSNYDISSLLKEIFTADWFYEEDIKGAKIKSPMELLVGYQRMLPMVFDDDTTTIQMQRVLGQHLFNPPNVAGWPGGRYWINSSSLTLRMKLPEALFTSKELNPHLKPQRQGMHYSGNISFEQDEPLRIGKVAVDWTKYITYWKRQPREQLPAALVNYLLHVPVPDEQMKTVAANADNSSDEAYIKSLTTLLMALPEFQLT
jgi:uncharacterized protein (DUF1800 family)